MCVCLQVAGRDKKNTTVLDNGVSTALAKQPRGCPLDGSVSLHSGSGANHLHPGPNIVRLLCESALALQIFFFLVLVLVLVLFLPELVAFGALLRGAGLLDLQLLSRGIFPVNSVTEGVDVFDSSCASLTFLYVQCEGMEGESCDWALGSMLA